MIWALIDTSYLAHRARCSVKGLEFDGTPTNVIFGFMEEMRHIATHPKVQSNRIALCFDSSESLRREQFPEYKLKRHDTRTPDEIRDIASMKRQVRRLRVEILPSIGLPIYRQSGLESDDLMAQGAKQLDMAGPAFDIRGVMVTADGDLYQSITPRVAWFDPARDLWLGYHELVLKKGLEPHQWAQMKVLSGCYGDNVPGIKGIGEKTATDYILNMLKITSKKYAAIVSPAAEPIKLRNHRLVVLPHEKTRPIDFRIPEWQPKEFYRWCKRLGMKSYLSGSRRRAWDAFFAGDFDGPKQQTRKRGEDRVGNR